MIKTARSFALSLALLFVSAVAYAQGPNGSGIYYKNANGKCGSELKTALFNIIKVTAQDVTSYNGLITAYELTDTRPDGYVRDWYSNITNYRHGVDTGGYKKEGDSYNREHTVPQSWFNEASPMKSDVVHVVPTDGYVNNRRSSYPFGEVESVTYKSANGYCKLGSCKTPGYSGTVFEPNDEIKGDIARIYFYMVTCYEDKATGWGHSVFASSKYPGLQQWVLDMMMRWSKQDPVDEVETARNNAVQQVQGNRNPFVDYPGLEDYVWGTKVEQPFSYNNYQGGSNDSVFTVVQPVFNPIGGTYVKSVTVGIRTNTEGATIHYTTDGSEPTEQNTVYSDSLTFTVTTTLKAIAMKDGGKSAVTEATYVIKDEGGPVVEPVNSTIEINKTFFNVDYKNTVGNTHTEDFIGTQDGIKVVYSLGNGVQRYVNESQIRLYPGNNLTFSVEAGAIREVVFSVAKTSSNPLLASNGFVKDLKWTGDAQNVVFSAGGESGHLQITTASVIVDAGSSGITEATTTTVMPTVYYDLQGRRVMNPVKGLYVVNGKKVYCK